MCRVAGKALYENIVLEEGNELRVISMYDASSDANGQYFPASIFSGYGNRRLAFVFGLLRNGIGARSLIISHVHLLLPAVLIKLLSPKTRLLLIAHGIEVWKPVGRFKQWLMRKCDLVLPVSHFTKNKLLELYGLPESKLTVLNNCLDPFLPVPLVTPKDSVLQQELGILPTDFVWMMLSRLADTEQQKGYDLVLTAIAGLRQDFPGIKYLMAGKYTPGERERIEALARQLSIAGSVIFTGFVPEAQLANYYRMADGYIMPSKKEGFGIVLIEALYYGLPVIAGNKDGSTDALDNGRFGLLINPDSIDEIKAAMRKVMDNRSAFIPDQGQVEKQFGFDVYRGRWRGIVNRH